MNARLKLLGIVALSIVGGAVLSYALSGLLASALAPSGHRTITALMRITNTSRPDHFNLTATCVSQGSFVSGGPPMALWTPGNSYSQSTWIWFMAGDPELSVVISGPFDDGLSYMIECSLLSGSGYQIYCNGHLQLTFPPLTNTAPGVLNLGTSLFYVTL